MGIRINASIGEKELNHAEKYGTVRVGGYIIIATKAFDEIVMTEQGNEITFRGNLIDQPQALATVKNAALGKLRITSTHAEASEGATTRVGIVASANTIAASEPQEYILNGDTLVDLIDRAETHEQRVALAQFVKMKRPKRN